MQFYMNKNRIHRGFSLSELMTVIGVMALLIGIAVPASKAIMDSVNSSAGMRSMISSSLSAARAIAMKEHKYAGIRFQTDINGDQYIVFIIHDDAPSVIDSAERAAYPEKTGLGMPPDNYGLSYGFRAVSGHKPIKLPGDGRVMDLVKVTRVEDTPYVAAVSYTQADMVNSGMIDDPYEFNDASAFSIIFSPEGKLVTMRVWVRNRHGIPDHTALAADNSADKIFNKKVIVDSGNSLLYQDDYFGSSWSPYSYNLGYGPEDSRKSFIIYDKTKFDDFDDVNLRWTNYLGLIEKIYVNPYNGQLVGGHKP